MRDDLFEKHIEFNPSSSSATLLLNSNFNKAYCKCIKCGNQAEVDASTMLTSNPPKYNYHCPQCNNYGYVKCSDVFYDIRDNRIAAADPIPVVTESFGTPCLICGNTVLVSMFDNHSKICEKCKKAVLKLRKILEED